MIRIQLFVTHEEGLHARPAVQFVNKASGFQSDIHVRNATTDTDWINAKSILSVLTLGVEPNHNIELEIAGQDEAEAAAALKELVDTNFGSG